jgi:hypothetical protein
MSSNVIRRIGKNVETTEKRMKRSSKSKNKSIVKPPDYADRRELKSLSYFGI